MNAALADVWPVPPFAMGSSVGLGALDHAGAPEGPVDVMTWPLVLPAGLSSWIGVRVVAATAAENAKAKMESSFFAVVRLVNNKLTRSL